MIGLEEDWEDFWRGYTLGQLLGTALRSSMGRKTSDKRPVKIAEEEKEKLDRIASECDSTPEIVYRLHLALFSADVIEAYLGITDKFLYRCLYKDTCERVKIREKMYQDLKDRKDRTYIENDFCEAQERRHRLYHMSDDAEEQKKEPDRIAALCKILCDRGKKDELQDFIENYADPVDRVRYYERYELLFS